MKKLSTNITNENGETKKITVFVEDETVAALAHCDEEIRHFYILEEHEAQNLTRKETRRHCSLEEALENGQAFGTDEYNPAAEILRREENEELYEALQVLTDKQYKALWLYAVKGISFREIGEIMGVHKETVREYYNTAIKKLQKILL